MDKKYKLLIVDDDPNLLLLMEKTLKPQGYHLVLLNDSARVIQTARKEKPDLILLDIMMPRSDGYTTLYQLKSDESLSNIPVAMISAVGFENNKQLAKVYGASAYVTKPIDKKVLLETITRFLPGPA